MAGGRRGGDAGRLPAGLLRGRGAFTPVTCPGGFTRGMAIDGFAQPWWLVLLVPVAALVVGYLWAQKRRHRAALRFSNLALLERVATRLPGWQRHIPAALLAVALLLLTVGLAGPTAETKVPRNRATVVLVIDVSLSMQSTDVSPTRLTAAQDAASTFVRGMPPTINLGLESFAGTPAILVPPTTDRDAVVSQIQTLKLAESTATGEALAAALNACHLNCPNRRSGIETCFGKPLQHAAAVRARKADG